MSVGSQLMWRWTGSNIKNIFFENLQKLHVGYDEKWVDISQCHVVTN